jgi:hypothetical protein
MHHPSAFNYSKQALPIKTIANRRSHREETVGVTRRDRRSHKEETERATKKTEEGVAKKRQIESLG